MKSPSTIGELIRQLVGSGAKKRLGVVTAVMADRLSVLFKDAVGGMASHVNPVGGSTTDFKIGDYVEVYKKDGQYHATQSGSVPSLTVDNSFQGFPSSTPPASVTYISDGKVLVSPTDSTRDYLANKISTGPSIKESSQTGGFGQTVHLDVNDAADFTWTGDHRFDRTVQTKDIVPSAPDMYSLGSHSRPFERVHTRYLAATVIGLQEEQYSTNGRQVIARAAGTFPSAVQALDTEIDFGMVIEEIPSLVSVYSSDSVSGEMRQEYILVDDHISGTLYRVTRNLEQTPPTGSQVDFLDMDFEDPSEYLGTYLVTVLHSLTVQMSAAYAEPTYFFHSLSDDGALIIDPGNDANYMFADSGTLTPRSDKFQLVFARTPRSFIIDTEEALRPHGSFYTPVAKFYDDVLVKAEVLKYDRTPGTPPVSSKGILEYNFDSYSKLLNVEISDPSVPFLDSLFPNSFSWSDGKHKLLPGDGIFLLDASGEDVVFSALGTRESYGKQVPDIVLFDGNGNLLSPQEHELVVCHRFSGNRFSVTSTMTFGSTPRTCRSINLTLYHCPPDLNPSWESGTVFVVLGDENSGQISLVANQGKPFIKISSVWYSPTRFQFNDPLVSDDLLAVQEGLWSDPPNNSNGGLVETESAVIGNMDGYYGEANFSGFGVGDYENKNYLKYGVDGFELVTGNGGVKLDNEGICILVEPFDSFTIDSKNSISFKNTSAPDDNFVRIANAFSGTTTSRFYLYNGVNKDDSFAYPYNVSSTTLETKGAGVAETNIRNRSSGLFAQSANMEMYSSGQVANIFLTTNSGASAGLVISSVNYNSTSAISASSTHGFHTNQLRLGSYWDTIQGISNPPGVNLARQVFATEPLMRPGILGHWQGANIKPNGIVASSVPQNAQADIPHYRMNAEAAQYETFSHNGSTLSATGPNGTNGRTIGVGTAYAYPHNPNFGGAWAEGWIKFTSLATTKDHYIIGRWEALLPGFSWEFYIRQVSSVLRFSWGICTTGTNLCVWDFGTTLPAGVAVDTWFHFWVGYYPNSLPVLYINGQQVAVTNPPFFNTTGFSPPHASIIPHNPANVPVRLGGTRTSPDDRSYYLAAQIGWGFAPDSILLNNPNAQINGYYEATKVLFPGH